MHRRQTSNAGPTPGESFGRMPIHYALYENHLTDGPNDYLAQIRPTMSVGLNDIVAHILDQGSSATEGDILLILSDAIKACETVLLEGGRVNLGGLVELFPRIGGVFVGPGDHFDPTRHRIDVGANPGHRLRRTIRDKATVEKVSPTRPAPNPVEFVDLASGTSNTAISPGNIGTINGHRLKYNPGAPDEGIYFLPVAGGSEVRAEFIQKNKPSQLIFLNPDGLSGEYHLEVRAHMQGGAQLRTGRLDATLSVQ